MYGFGFSLGGVRVLAGGIGQGVLLVLTVADPGANAIGGVEAWVLSGCLSFCAIVVGSSRNI